MNPLTFLAITVSCVFGRKLPQRNFAERQCRQRIPLCELIATIVLAVAGGNLAPKKSIAFAKSAARKVADLFLMNADLIFAEGVSAAATLCRDKRKTRISQGFAAISSGPTMIVFECFEPGARARSQLTNGE